jgi:L-iditol 2-dehydrogenase
LKEGFISLRKEGIMAKNMLAVLKTQKGRGVEVREVPSPTCGQQEVIIEVKAAGICGSDLHAYESLAGFEWVPLPVIMGHEFSGNIVEIGKGVQRYKVGDRVTAEPAVPCQECYFCRTGHPNICANRLTYGFARNGAFARYVSFPAHSLFSLPDSVSFEEAACLEPLGVALHAMEVSRYQPGDAVMILGPGPIGLFLAQILAGSGAYKVFLVGIEADRARLEMGAKLASAQTLLFDKDLLEKVHAETQGRGPDVVFDCSGDAGAGAQAIQLVRAGGQVVWVSIYQKPVTVDGSSLVRRDINLQAARSRVPQTWYRAMRFLEQKKVRVLELVTHRFLLDQAAELFEIMLRREGIKGLLFPGPPQ